MKKQKLIIAILILFNCQFSFAQQYKLQLDKLNNYLKTINNGYYGYFEVNGNDIYLRLQSGKYCKATITDLDKAYPEVENKSVFLKCKNGTNCMTATYTSSNTNGIIMSNNTNINTTEFVQLINDFLLAFRATNPTPSLQTQVNSTSNTENKTTTSIEKALNKLNDYLITFDNGHYGYFEVKDGYVYDWFKAGKYNKFKMEDIEGAVVEEKFNRVILKCKNDNKCISTDWKVNGKEDYSQFINGSAYNYQELADLLNNFRDAYLGKTPVVSNNTTAKTNKELQNNVDTALAERAKVVDVIINNKPVQKTTSNDIEFKKGDKIIIKEVYTSDGHFRVGGKSLCVGEKGTILSIGYDEINVSYYGKIKMDNGKIEEFDDFQPELYFNNAVLDATPLANTTLQVQENLQKLNQILKTLDGGAYSVAEIINGTLFFRRKEGSSLSMKLQDISKKLSFKANYGGSSTIYLNCKDEKKCVNYSDKTGTYKSTDDYGLFANSGSEAIELLTILNALLESYQPSEAHTEKKTGTLADCKFILSEGCQNYFMQATINDLRSQFTLRESSAEFYKGDGFEVSVEPSSGGIIEVKFYKSFGKKPSNNIKWGEGMIKVREKYGQGSYSRFTQEYLKYPGVELEFWNGDLSFITFKRERTTSELLAYNIRQIKENEAKAKTELAEAAIEARKTPEQRTKETADAKARTEEQMQTDYKELLDQLDVKLREGDRIIQSEKTAIAAGGIFKAAVQKKLDKVISAGDGLIDSFNRKYQRKIPTWMAKEIIAKWRPAAVN